MMYMPSIFGEDLFDDFMDGPFREMSRFDKDLDKKLYGRHAAHEMKTDVRELNDHYEVDIDLPGFTKDEVSAKLENGYLTIRAAKSVDKDEQNKETGKYIRRERYAGSMSRAFYIGEDVKQEEITAKFANGILTLNIPKKDAKQVEVNKYISIEG